MTITSSQTGGFTAAAFLLLRRSRFVQSVAGFLLELVAGFVGIRIQFTHNARKRGKALLHALVEVILAPSPRVPI